MEKDKALNLLQNGLLPQVHGAYYEALKMAIKALQPEQNAYKEGYDAHKRMIAREAKFNHYCPRCMGRLESCEDVISRQAAINAIDALYLDGESAQGFTADANDDCLIGKYKAIEILDELPSVIIKNKEEKRMSDLIKRSAALRPYEGLRDDDLISVRTIRENLEHVQTVDFEDEGKCSTCKHDFGRENCGSCEWDSVKHINTNWEPRILEDKE